MGLKFTSNYPTIVCLGDSQTQSANSPGGFVAALADTYQRKADVIGRGFNGYTTRDVLPIVPDFISKSTPDSKNNIVAIILWLGCNDSINADQKQYVSPEDFNTNLHKILDHLRPNESATAAPYILVVSPTPVSDDRPFHTNERKVLYTKLVQQVVEERKDGNLQFLNAFELLMKHHLALKMLLHEDGLHISPAGYEVLSLAFKEKLAAQHGLDPQNMPDIYPDWKTF